MFNSHFLPWVEISSVWAESEHLNEILVPKFLNTWSDSNHIFKLFVRAAYHMLFLVDASVLFGWLFPISAEKTVFPWKIRPQMTSLLPWSSTSWIKSRHSTWSYHGLPHASSWQSWKFNDNRNMSRENGRVDFRAKAKKLQSKPYTFV